LVGSINTIIGMNVIFILIYMGVDNYKANIIGYIVGLNISFFLHKYYTFNDSKKISFKQVFIFVIIFLLSYSINIITLYLSLLYFPNYFAQVLGMIAFTIVNYILNKLITFKRKINVQK